LNLATVLTAAAVVVFILAALGVGSGVPLLAIGLACFAAGHLPWPI
jgi:hypothetical protein